MHGYGWQSVLVCLRTVYCMSKTNFLQDNKAYLILSLINKKYVFTVYWNVLTECTGFLKIGKLNIKTYLGALMLLQNVSLLGILYVCLSGSSSKRMSPMLNCRVSGRLWGRTGCRSSLWWLCCPSLSWLEKPKWPVFSREWAVCTPPPSTCCCWESRVRKSEKYTRFQR